MTRKQRLKFIDFGSATLEGQTIHSYSQCPFYRSLEVVIGMPYGSIIR